MDDVSTGAADGSTKTLSVLIVDDQMPFRAVARTVIGMTAGFEVTSEAESGEDAVAQVDAHPPDLVLMDINLPGISAASTRPVRSSRSTRRSR